MATARAPHRAGLRGRPGYDLDSLLAVAVKVFNDRGYDGTSMEVLAGRLGIAKSSIYHHVSGKAELLDLALSRALNALSALFAVPLEGRYVDRLEYLVRGIVEILVAELPYVTLLLRIRGNNQVERKALARRRELDAFLGDLVVGAVNEGGLRTDIDPALVLRLLFGTVFSLIEWYKPQTGGSANDLADAVVALTFDGLRRS